MTTEDLERSLFELENEYAEGVALEMSSRKLDSLWTTIVDVRQQLREKASL